MPSRSKVEPSSRLSWESALFVRVQGLDFGAARVGEVALDLQDRVGGAFCRFRVSFARHRAQLPGTRGQWRSGVNLIEIGADVSDVVVYLNHNVLLESL